MLSDLFYKNEPMVKVLDFLLDLPELDYTKAELAKECESSWQRMDEIIPHLLELGMLEEARKKRGQTYKLNKDSPILHTLLTLNFEIRKRYNSLRSESALQIKPENKQRIAEVTSVVG